MGVINPQILVGMNRQIVAAPRKGEPWLARGEAQSHTILAYRSEAAPAASRNPLCCCSACYQDVTALFLNFRSLA